MGLAAKPSASMDPDANPAPTEKKSAVGSNKRRKVSQHKYVRLIGDAGVSSLLLVCVVFALAYQSTNDIDNTNEENLGVRMGAQQMSMSMGRSIQVMAASEEVPVFA